MSFSPLLLMQSARRNAIDRSSIDRRNAIGQSNIDWRNTIDRSNIDRRNTIGRSDIDRRIVRQFRNGSNPLSFVCYS